jgi:nucleotide-binding universal stress UspA family protein
VVALAVLKPAPHTEDAAEGAADFDGRQRFAQETFAKARDSLPSAQRDRVTLQFAQAGDAARTVCEHTQQHGFDLLVVDRHGTRRRAAPAAGSCRLGRGERQPADRATGSLGTGTVSLEAITR